MKFTYFYRQAICLLLVFLLPACDVFDNKKEEVSSGTAQLRSLVFVKKCLSGSLTIETESALESVNPDDLKMGDKVFISGSINNASVCGYSSEISFSCEGSVRISGNRTFVCSTGFLSNSVSSSGSGSVSGSISAVATLGTTNKARGFLSGDFHIYENSTKMYSRIHLSSASSLVPQATCVLSFTC